jgi:hypothetical protein
MPKPTAPTELIARALADLHDVFEDHGIWHALIYGTLLGAVRDGDVIPWDHDFDLLVRPDEVERILALNPQLARRGYSLDVQRHWRARLCMNRDGVPRFSTQALAVYAGQEKIGDLYTFVLFEDGVLRRYDFANHTYWCPHSSFPAWFVEGPLGAATVRGRRYPVPRDAEKLIAGIYGEDWRVPYVAALQGGTIRAGTTVHGDKYEPKLAAEIAWCEAQGWDRSAYRGRGLPRWPQPVTGGGPVGPIARTKGNSRSLWWKDLKELVDYF